ncbi:hypothetical protein [Hyphomicrobium sp.]|uniref:hypothetical protein n=1 Tax=Hyphomicrobium sp. TaxID=82 RepID=UPI0025BB82B4|nr:hypothetical protein [Hyphomicrobium sp.]MCC7253091.1 hypothetical protein [Hyphomicrobium sp.]
MLRKVESPHFRKHLPDLLAGLAVFALLIGLAGWHLGIAASDASVGATMDRNASVVLLGVAFAAMVVFNVAFVRHLRRAYAAPRKAAIAPAARSDRGRQA